MFLSYEVALALIALIFYFGRCSKTSPVERIIQTEKPVEVIREIEVEVIKEKIVEVVKQTVVKECSADCIIRMAKDLYSASDLSNHIDLIEASDLDEQEAMMNALQNRMNSCMELAIKAHQAIQPPQN